jgi:flagellar biogenesis protein FliO
MGVTELFSILLILLLYIGAVGLVIWFAVRLLRAVESIAKNIQKIVDKE